MERWLDVIGYEGFYQVSNLGQVKSVDRVISHSQGGTRKWKGKILRPARINNIGHLKVTLSKEGIKSQLCVHRLVAVAWIGPCPDGQEVRHGPNGITDNSVSNLCYGTHQENSLDMRRDGSHGGRPVRRSDGVEFISLTVAAEESNCWLESIWSVCNGRRKTTGGFGWEYI